MEVIATAMEKLRLNPPAAIHGASVLARADFEAGTRTLRDSTHEALPFPSSNVLVYELEGGDRIIARPSGTEPKIKFYFDVREEMREGEPLADAAARARAKMDALAEAFCKLAGMS
jgi:phosphomannomutase